MLNDTDSSLAMNAICYAAEAWKQAAHTYEAVVDEQRRPFNTIKPKVFPDGNQWCALYGDDLQTGVAGFGDTPEKASFAFDKAWLNDTPSIVVRSATQERGE